MFNCQNCHKTQPTMSTPHTVVVEKRQKTYPATDSRREGHGWEIVREVRVCTLCALVLTKSPGVFDITPPAPAPAPVPSAVSVETTGPMPVPEETRA